MAMRDCGYCGGPFWLELGGFSLCVVCAHHMAEVYVALAQQYEQYERAAYREKLRSISIIRPRHA